MLRLVRGVGIVLVGLSVLSICWAADGEKEKKEKSAPKAWCFAPSYHTTGMEKEKKAKSAPKAAAAKPEMLPAPGQEAIRKALDSPVTLEFLDTPLGDVLDFLRDATRLPIHLDRKALEDVGVATDTPITFNHRGLRLRLALDLLLRDPGLTWTVQDQVLLITTPDESENLLETQVYDVRDMVAIQDEKGRSANDFDSLIDLVTTTIEPTTWDQVGGPGSIAPFEMEGTAAIVIRQTWRIQEKTQRLFDELRAARKGQLGKVVPRRVRQLPEPAAGPVSPQCQPQKPAQGKPAQPPAGGVGGANSGGMGMF